MTREASATARQYPLPDRQLRGIVHAARELEAEQLLWMSGYLAGLARARVVSDDTAALLDKPAVPAAGSEPARQVTVLYGSETGNAEGVATQLSRQLTENGLPVKLVNMRDYQSSRLRRETHLIVVVSTHGEGDPPEDAEDFHEFLSGRRTPRLESLQYAVLALGDSSYAHFCATGRQVDARLAELGAKRLHPRVDCDVDFAAPANHWTDSVSGLLERELARATAPVSAETGPASVASAAPAGGRRIEVEAELQVSQPITATGAAGDVRHVELLFPEGQIVYTPGDALSVLPENPPQTVETLLQSLGLAGSETVTVGKTEKPLAEALSRDLEITALSRGFLERYADIADSGELRKLLEPGHEAALAHALATEQIINIVKRVPASLDAATFVNCLRPLASRSYSIASSLAAHPGEAHLTVAVIDYERDGFRHYGAASTWLADRLAAGSRFVARIEPNPRFRLPGDPDTPVIMIGPGTGVAPFRAFLQERESQGAQGRNWLFFGAPHFRTDFLYQIDWLRWRKQGLLTRMDAAFSRDQAHKVYVQHRLAEQARDIYIWLEEGAHFYVCGSRHMAPDVHRALRDIVQRQGNRSEEQAEAYLKTLKRECRYQRDVY